MDDGVSIGVVNHNGAPYLARTLEAVGRLGPRVDDVVLVDSGSTDDGVAFVREHHPHVRVIELSGNGGPGVARNAAIRAATHDRIVLIDNDARPEPGCVEALGAALDARPNGVIAMAAVAYENAPDTIQFAGARAHFLGTLEPMHVDSPRAGLDGVVRPTASAISCCMMIDRGRFGNRPWFDERLFFHFEDHELGLRVTLQGFDCLVVPSAICSHGEGTIGVSIRQTGRFTAMRVRYTIRNRWLTILMLYQWTTLLRFAPALFAFELFQLVGATRKGWLGHWLWAAGSALRTLPYVVQRRHALRPMRRRCDLDVLTGGPFPYNKAMHRSALEHVARRAMDAIAQFSWRIGAGGSAEAAR